MESQTQRSFRDDTSGDLAARKLDLMTVRSSGFMHISLGSMIDETFESSYGPLQFGSSSKPQRS